MWNTKHFFKSVDCGKCFSSSTWGLEYPGGEDLLEFDVDFCLSYADEANIRDGALFAFLSRCHSSNQWIETGNVLNSYVTGLHKPGNDVLCFSWSKVLLFNFIRIWENDLLNSASRDAVLTTNPQWYLKGGEKCMKTQIQACACIKTVCKCIHQHNKILCLNMVFWSSSCSISKLWVLHPLKCFKDRRGGALSNLV